eukprot:Opistho-2@21040
MRKVLGEVSGLNRLDRSRRQRCGILGEGGVVVEGGPVRETLGPRKDRRQRVEADVRIPLGICRKVAGESPVTSLRHDNLAIARDKGARHESNRTKTSSHGARLDIAVIVLARPHKSAVRLDCICNHVVNQAVLVPDLHLVKLALVALVVDCLEDVLEASVILLKDCVLAAEVQRLLALNGGIEARVRECLNRRVRVVHSNGNTRLLKLKHVSARLLAVCGGECDLEVAGTGCEKVRSIKLVARRLPDDCDWVGPRGNGGMDVLRTNLFADNDTTMTPRMVALALLSSPDSSGVVVAHLTAAPTSLMAAAASLVIWSFVRRRFSRVRSKVRFFTSTWGSTSFLDTRSHNPAATPSPLISTMGFATETLEAYWRCDETTVAARTIGAA